MSSEKIFIKCDCCGVVHETSGHGGNFLDYGWSFSYPDLGHYGGFTDHFEELVDMRDPEIARSFLIHMCHDCCVKLLELFPLLADRMHVHGGHPNKNEHDATDANLIPPCCPYSWTFVYNENEPDRSKRYKHYRATKDLTWEEFTLPGR